MANLQVQHENIFVPQYSRSKNCYILIFGLATYLFLRLVHFKISEKDSQVFPLILLVRIVYLCYIQTQDSQANACEHMPTDQMLTIQKKQKIKSLKFARFHCPAKQEFSFQYNIICEIHIRMNVRRRERTC